MKISSLILIEWQPSHQSFKSYLRICLSTDMNFKMSFVKGPAYMASTTMVDKRMSHKILTRSCCRLLCCVYIKHIDRVIAAILPISFRVALLELGQLHVCAGARGVTPKDEGKFVPYQTKTNIANHLLSSLEVCYWDVIHYLSYLARFGYEDNHIGNTMQYLTYAVFRSNNT